MLNGDSPLKFHEDLKIESLKLREAERKLKKKAKC